MKINRDKKEKVVMLRSKHDRKPKDISEEPEMKRLNKLLDEGKISQDRLDRYLETERSLKKNKGPREVGHGKDL